MATYQIPGQNLTFNLPDEGTVFRATGDANQDAVYKVVNGQLTTISSRSYVPSTDLRMPDGSIAKGGQPYTGPYDISRQGTPVDPNYRGPNASPTSGGDSYKMTTGSDYRSLPEFNMADIQTVLAKTNGMLPKTSATQTVDPTNPNGSVVTSDGAVVSAPNPAPQPGAITPPANFSNYQNPNAAMQVPTAPTPATAQSTVAAQPTTPAQPSPFGAAYGSLGGQNLPVATPGAAPVATPTPGTATQPTLNSAGTMGGAPAPSPFGSAFGSLGGPNLPVAAPTPTTPTQTSSPTPGQAAAVQKPPLTFNGSVVDLLDAAGTDSSYANRATLAAQYGIANYTGTPQQNTDLANKFLNLYNSKQGSAAPQTGADARSSINQSLAETQQTPAQKQPISSFYDSLGSMDPIVSSLYSQINQILSTPVATQTFTDLYQQLTQQQGIPALQTQLMDINNIMNGTEQDIKDEITKSGGFATSSQVQALVGARNKTLIQQANQLQQQLSLKENYVNQIMQLTQADRAEVEKQVDRKLGLTTQLVQMQESMNSAARGNLTTLISAVGYNGLAGLLQNDPNQRSQAEKILGLPQGALSSPAFLQAATPAPKLTTQIVEVDGRKALVTFDSTGNPTNLVDLGSAATAGSGGLTPGQVNAFNSIVSKYNSSPLVQASDRTAVLQGTIANIKKDPSNAAQQLNLAYSYVQALDTYQSAVREGELGLVNSIDSKIGQLNNSVQQIQNGQIVRPEVALQIATAAQSIVDTINSAAKQKAQSFESQANVVGLGPYWNQYVSGFNQGYNQNTPLQKGTMSSSQYVEKALTQSGKSYQQVLDQIPLGSIGVIDNNTGEIGSIPAEDYNPSQYTRI